MSRCIARWSCLAFAWWGCAGPEPVPVTELAEHRAALSRESGLACVAGYVERGACDWAHWSELYEACEIYADPVLDDGLLLAQVKAGACTREAWPSLRAQIVEPHRAPVEPVRGTLHDALNCVAGYVHRGACDWAHWSELYEVCETHRFPTLDDGLLLDVVARGECSWDTWPMLYEHATAEDSVPAPVPVEAPETFAAALDCVGAYAARGACDWAHWSEMYERCRTYAQPALDDGRLIAEVQAGQCSAESWPALRARLLPDAAEEPTPGDDVLTPVTVPQPVLRAADFEDALYCVAGFAARAACDEAHWAEMLEACTLSAHPLLADGAFQLEVQEGRCTWEAWSELYGHLSFVPQAPDGEPRVYDPTLGGARSLRASLRGPDMSRSLLDAFFVRVRGMPGDDGPLLAALGAAGTDAARFRALRDVFAALQVHARAQGERLMPSGLELAQRLESEAASAGEELSAIAARFDAQDPAAAPSLLLALTEAQRRAQEASGQERALHDYATLLQSDEAQLDALRDTYRGATTRDDSGQLQATLGRLVDLTHQLAAAQADYNYNRDVAASTAAYAWIWPWGTIAAASVAGTHGARATAAQELMRVLEGRIASETQAVRELQRRLGTLAAAETLIAPLAQDTDGARPVIGAMRLLWQQLRHGLEQIARELADARDARSVLHRRVLFELGRVHWRDVQTLTTTHPGR